MIGVKFKPNPDGSPLTAEQKQEQLNEILEALAEEGLVASVHFLKEDESVEESYNRITAEHEREVLKQSGKDKEDLN
jgi:transcription initiation factor IIE alpha subunit